jgi:hypothetical protein
LGEVATGVSSLKSVTMKDLPPLYFSLSAIRASMAGPFGGL